MLLQTLFPVGITPSVAPNMNGEFRANVFAPVRDYAECEALVDRCGVGEGGCSPPSAFRSFEDVVDALSERGLRGPRK